jgi:hypothetical protein
MVVLTFVVMSDYKDDRTEGTPAPADGTELFGVIVLLVN